jgi:hypothetical protein
MGYGFEIISHYPNSTITFCDIENIHVMRNSVAKVRDILYSADDSKFAASLIETGWLQHQYQILISSIKIADLVHNQNTSVLIHCSTSFASLLRRLLLWCVVLTPLIFSFTPLQRMDGTERHS